MTYMYCASCGLHVRTQAGVLEIEICPRCLAREATGAPLLTRAGGGLAPAGGARSSALRARIGSRTERA